MVIICMCVHIDAVCMHVIRVNILLHDLLSGCHSPKPVNS